jgi:hypothetical protein
MKTAKPTVGRAVSMAIAALALAGGLSSCIIARDPWGRHRGDRREERHERRRDDRRHDQHGTYHLDFSAFAGDARR